MLSGLNLFKAVFIKLAQKYRPSIFDDVIGQESTIEVLKAIVIQKKYNAAYIFSGPRGCGKTTLGRIFSKAILCDAPINGNPCCICESCVQFSKEQNYGYREMDAASCGGKEDMVKLRDDAKYLSVAKKKIILIDECQDISNQGQDALLKQIEQCPDHLIYLFCTTEPDQMKDTVLDRCMKFQILKVKTILIKQRLKKICEQEKIVYDEETLGEIAIKSDGHVRDAVSILEEIAYIGDISKINFNKISKNYDENIFNILSNLGIDLVKVIESYQEISSYLSAIDFYKSLLAMVGDASKLLCGYENFSEHRKNMLLNLKERHGYSLLEFLNYLITRDKYIDKIGLQSDLIFLHYKFSANNFVPHTAQKELQSNPQTAQEPLKKETSLSLLSHNELMKLPSNERSRILREQRKNKKQESEEPENVPGNWPLPKDDRLGEINTEDVLTSQEFSQNLVGGRGNVRTLVDPGIK